MRSGAHEGLTCPLEKGVRGIETSGSGYLRQQIRGGHKGRAERQGLGQSPNKKQGRWLGQLVVLSNSPRAMPLSGAPDDGYQNKINFRIIVN